MIKAQALITGKVNFDEKLRVEFRLWDVLAESDDALAFTTVPIIGDVLDTLSQIRFTKD